MRRIQGVVHVITEKHGCQVGIVHIQVDMPEGELDWDYPEDCILECGQQAEYPGKKEEIEEKNGFWDCFCIREDYAKGRRWGFPLCHDTSIGSRLHKDSHSAALPRPKYSPDIREIPYGVISVHC